MNAGNVIGYNKIFYIGYYINKIKLQHLKYLTFYYVYTITYLIFIFMIFHVQKSNYTVIFIKN